jgi:hypothetical protein
MAGMPSQQDVTAGRPAERQRSRAAIEPIVRELLGHHDGRALARRMRDPVTVQLARLRGRRRQSPLLPARLRRR